VALAYAACNLLAVVVGGVLGAALPTRAIGLVGGVLFLGFAAWTVWGGEHEHDHELDEDDEASVDGAESGSSTLAGSRSVVLSVFGAMFVAELGDKTQIATATLAAQGNPVLVWIGATLGIILSGAIGVLVGRFFGSRLPERVTRIGSAVLFALFGVVLLATNV